MTLVHESDAYGRLVAVCNRMDYSLEISRTGSSFELRVVGPGKDARISSQFRPGRENGAAAILLRKLRTAA